MGNPSVSFADSSLYTREPLMRREEEESGRLWGKEEESGKPYKWEFGGKTFRGFYDIMLSWEVGSEVAKGK